MKKEAMKHLMAAAMMFGGAIMASSSAYGQTFAVNDLYLGFQNQTGGGTADYIVNLGAASNLVGGSAAIDLSSDFSLANFNSVLGTSSSMYGGVVGGSALGSPTSDVYLTQLRSGGAGTPSVPGSSVTAIFTRSQDNAIISPLSNLNAPAAGAGILDASKTWENYVEPTFTASSFYGNCGMNPDSVVGKSTVLYEDLWYTSQSTISGKSGFTYEGYFTLDLTGANPKLTFTPKNAPGQLTAPVIASITKAAGTVTLIWSTVPPHSYQLQYTASLSPTNWINIGSAVTANAATMTNTDSTAGTNPQRFYRIVAQ